MINITGPHLPPQIVDQALLNHDEIDEIIKDMERILNIAHRELFKNSRNSIRDETIESGRPFYNHAITYLELAKRESNVDDLIFAAVYLFTATLRILIKSDQISDIELIEADIEYIKESKNIKNLPDTNIHVLAQNVISASERILYFTISEYEKYLQNKSHKSNATHLIVDQILIHNNEATEIITEVERILNRARQELFTNSYWSCRKDLAIEAGRPYYNHAESWLEIAKIDANVDTARLAVMNVSVAVSEVFIDLDRQSDEITKTRIDYDYGFILESGKIRNMPNTNEFELAQTVNVAAERILNFVIAEHHLHRNQKCCVLL